MHLTRSDPSSGRGRSGGPQGAAVEPADVACLSRYGKRADLIVHERDPFNAETGPAALAEGPLTANDAFYVRGHGPEPEPAPPDWHLRVHGLVERELKLSLSTLREAFRPREVTATVQCAGNRRVGLAAIRDIPGEALWGPGATGTATWTGAALGDVLAVAKPARDAMHVGFEGSDLCSEASPPQRFGGSIPLDKACRPEVLLAWEMNGQPLPLIHGAPLRVVVPGYIGARSVKWVDRIEVRSTSWPGYFQQVAYRLLPADATPGPGLGMPLGLIALNADVLSPADGETVAAGPVEIRGYAFAGGERYVARVDLSVDGDADWVQARGPGDSGEPRSFCRPASTRSSSARGIPRRRRSRRTRRPSGTPRATSTMHSHGYGSGRLRSGSDMLPAPRGITGASSF
jgi:sulfite oxidase